MHNKQIINENYLNNCQDHSTPCSKSLRGIPKSPGHLDLKNLLANEFENESIEPYYNKEENDDNSLTILFDISLNLHHKNYNLVNKYEGDNNFSPKANIKNKELEAIFMKYQVESIENTVLSQNLYIENCLMFIKQINLRSSIKFYNKKEIYLPLSKFKYVICLDLDETLIYIDFQKKLTEYHYVYEGKDGRVGINFRPGLFSFLKNIFNKYEVILFTSSLKEYADRVLEIIDPQKSIFSYRLYRDHCLDICNYFIVKDLSIIANRSIENIILVDNNLINMYNQLNNGYLIPSFYNDETDIELIKLEQFLEKNDIDIINGLKEKFNFDEKLKKLN